MALKTFYNNYQIKSLKNTKLLNQKLYPKSWIRNEIKTKKDIKVVDNYVIIKHISCKNPLKKGHNLWTEDFIARNNNNKTLKLLLNASVLNKTTSVLKKYETSLKKVASKHEKKPLILLKSIKGGYSTYYSGMNGFLPKSQYKHAAQILKKNQKSFLKNLAVKKFFPSRLFLKLSKISVEQNNIKNNFVIQKTKHQFNNGLNLVFISKEQTKRNYENQKYKKTIRKHEHKLSYSKKKVLFNKKTETFK